MIVFLTHKINPKSFFVQTLGFTSKRTLTNKLFDPGAGVLFQLLNNLDQLFTQAD